MLGEPFSACEISHNQRLFIFIFVVVFVFLQHGAFAKAYDMYIDLLNERHKGKCLMGLL